MDNAKKNVAVLAAYPALLRPFFTAAAGAVPWFPAKRRAAAA